MLKALAPGGTRVRSERRSRWSLSEVRRTESLNQLGQQRVPPQRWSGTEGGSAVRTSTHKLTVPVARQADGAEAVAARDGDGILQHCQTY